MYSHLAHLDSFESGIHEGLRVKRGDILGRVGKTGTMSPHLHFEVLLKRYKKPTQYIWGLTRAEVSNLYADPEKWMADDIPAPFNNKSGYQYLDPIEEGGKVKGYHPGIDINWGSASDDYRNLVKSPIDGTVVFLGTDTSIRGWGNHLWIKEQEKNLMADYDNHLIQDTQETGSFALVYAGEKHIVSANRSGLAALTAFARSMKCAALDKITWDEIPTGSDF